MSEIKVKWPFVIHEFGKPYFNYIDLGNYTMYRMMVYKTTSPRLGMYVSIEDRGSFFFSIENKLHKDYVAMKLALNGDQAQVADFLNAQIHKDVEQQGHYYPGVISGVEPYGRIGEEKYMPWHPEIIKDEE